MIDALKRAWLLLILPHGPRLTSLLLAGLIAAECARTFLPLQSASATMASLTPPAGRGVQRSRLSAPDVHAIVEAHLFGLAADESQDPVHASPTTANLVLQGTLATRDPKGGIAILTADGPAKIYKVGDDVEGASLHSVYLDHIVLERSGRLETLSLPRPQWVMGNARPGPREDEDARSEGASNGHALSDLMRAEPSLDGQSDSLKGFRIRPGKTPAAFIRSGLRPGDLVTAVNGTPLADQDRQRSQAIVDTMLASNHATVSLVRNGKPMEVSVDGPE